MQPFPIGVRERTGLAPRITILQQVVPHYRVPFFLALRNRCEDSGLRLTLVHGPEPAGTAPVSAGAGFLGKDHEQWVPARALGFGLYWQPLPAELWESDLIVVEQANRHLINHLLMLRRFLGNARPRLAFWGHGSNLQGNPNSLRERFKKTTRQYVDYWFCYTEGVCRDLNEIPEARKISVDNAIDTNALREALKVIAPAVPKDPYHMLFIGSMQPYRRFDLLLPALGHIFSLEPKATIAFVGDGPESHRIRAFCAAHPERAVWHGALLGTEAASHLRRAGMMAMPGLIGLVALDSFASETPIVTTLNEGKSSPEFSYLKPGINAVIAPSNPEGYARALVDLMRTPAALDALRAGCRSSCDRYTIENMADRFHTGIIRALALPE